ncbi:MAG TPA: tyrosine-type recombinase/integrase [Candidatus Dormibacteraeota bacterium]|nr:tyrosine-type recombinase/integrase [Candidatus Dormibacteraeota bacterium]
MVLTTMASITKDAHQPPKSPFWIACYNGVGSDGKVQRIKRSTKTTDKKLAQKLAGEWEQLEKLAGTGRLTESHCRKVIAEMYERTVGEPLHFRTCREFLTEWVASKKNETELRAYLKYQQIVNEFLAYVGTKADRLLREITPADIRSWRDALKRKGLSAPTVNHAIKILRMPFKAAHDAGYIEINPNTKNTVRPLKDEPCNASKEVFTREQLSTLIKVAPSEDWKGAILCRYYTGLRLRDIADLQWSAVDLDARIITVTTRKTGKTLTVPIHPQFAAWLEKQTRGIGKAPVFPMLAGKSGGGKSGLSMAFKRIMERAKIKGQLLRNATGAGRSQSSLSFHSLRHSFNSAMANAGVAPEVRQKLTGHSSADMNRIYTHHELEPLRAAVATIPSL